MKLHAIIEKTAKFIASQGPQMEILIKAKQSNNPQFEFLNRNNRVNDYYKHVLNALKSGSYPVEEVAPEELSETDAAAAAEQHPTAAVELENSSVMAIQYPAVITIH